MEKPEGYDEILKQYREHKIDKLPEDVLFYKRYMWYLYDHPELKGKDLTKEEYLAVRDKNEEIRKEKWNAKMKPRYDEMAKNKPNKQLKPKRTKKTKEKVERTKHNETIHQHFERAFSESHLANGYFFIPDFPTSNGDKTYYWDYAIGGGNENIYAVIALDEIPASEELMMERIAATPEWYSICIIDGKRFKQGFENVIKLVMDDYEGYVERTFKGIRSIPFPYPHYTDIELMNSYALLEKMNPKDDEHDNVVMNTRQGDRLIQHFHQSIWHEHVDGELSPYEAWKDDKIMYEVIRNRIIYQTHLNPSKILQGFNIAKKAPKVSVFSAGRAKMLVDRYMKEFDTIFDPFSGFSGRMLGVIASGKRYIGQDISERHVRESNQILEFLQKYGVNVKAEVSVKNILESTGEYPCLFTCSPYGTKEQWEEVPVDPRTCDDWINECLKRFKCKRYIFVVDNTSKYERFVVAQVSNKSHLSNAKEHIIVINRSGV